MADILLRLNLKLRSYSPNKAIVICFTFIKENTGEKNIVEVIDTYR